MGMFGSIASALKGFNTPGTDGVSGVDKLALIASSFGDPETYAAGQKMFAGKKAQAKQQSLMDQVMGALGPQYATSAPLDVSTTPLGARGQTPEVNLGGGGGLMSQDTLPTNPTPPPGSIVEFPTRGSAQSGPTTFEMPQQTSAGLNSIADPRLPKLAMMAKMAGLDLSPMIDVLKANKPEYVNGVRVNPYDQNAPGFIPTLDKGQEPLYNSRGEIVGVRNMDGSVKAAADMAGAVTGAQEGAKAGWDLIAVPQSDGSTVMMPRAQAVGALGGGGGVGGVGQGSARLGVSQSPADKVRAEGRARTQVEREAGAPQAYAGLVDQDRASELTANTIHEILGDVRDPKTGAWTSGGNSMVGWRTTGFGANFAGLKGTRAHDLQAKLDQIRAATGFDELSKMRQQSPTGGALGSVSEQENRLLQSVRGSLDQGQDADQLAATLRQHLAQLEKLSAQRRQLYGSQYPGAQKGSSAGPDRSAIEAEMRRRGLIR